MRPAIPANDNKYFSEVTGSIAEHSELYAKLIAANFRLANTNEGTLFGGLGWNTRASATSANQDSSTRSTLHR